MKCASCKRLLAEVLLHCPCGKIWCSYECRRRQGFIQALPGLPSYCGFCRPRGGNNKQSNCFWCGKFVRGKQRTKDHVIPLYMGGIRKVAACKPCNVERGIISALATNNRFISPKRKRWKPLVGKWKSLIETKLDNPERDYCLIEIDIVLKQIKEAELLPLWIPRKKKLPL